MKIKHPNGFMLRGEKYHIPADQHCLYGLCGLYLKPFGQGKHNTIDREDCCKRCLRVAGESVMKVEG